MFVDPGRALFAKRQRALSDGLMRKAQTMQPTHWAQGLNQLTAGLVGQHLGRKADAAEAEIAKEKQGRLSAMLEGPDGVNPAALAGLGYGDAAVQMALGDRRFDRQTAREDAVYGRQRADALADAERSRGYAVEDRDLARQWQVGDRDARQRFQMGMYDRRRADQLAAAEAQQAQQPAADFGDANQLRGDYEKSIADFTQRQDAFATMNSVANQGTALGDIALVTQFFKTIDPQSTVRQSEFDSAAGARGVTGSLRQAIKQAQTGEILSPQQRQELIAAAAPYYEQSMATAQDTYERFGGFAEPYGLRNDNVVYDPVREFDRYGEAEAPAPQAPDFAQNDRALQIRQAFQRGEISRDEARRQLGMVQ